MPDSCRCALCCALAPARAPAGLKDVPRPPARLLGLLPAALAGDQAVGVPRRQLWLSCSAARARSRTCHPSAPASKAIRMTLPLVPERKKALARSPHGVDARREVIPGRALTD